VIVIRHFVIRHFVIRHFVIRHFVIDQFFALEGSRFGTPNDDQ